MKNSKLQKANEFSEPDNIMILDDSEYAQAYDSEYPKEVDIDELEGQMLFLETEINDLLFQIDELENENDGIDFILNNEAVDYFRAAELNEEKTYNNIKISELGQNLAILKRKYQGLESQKNAKYDL